MLNMRQVSKVFRTECVETHTLRDFNLNIKEGEFTALLGPSGSGKTTFLNIAGLLEDFDCGSYHLDGQDVSLLNDKQRSRLRNQKIGFIFQSFNLIPDMNAAENVGLPLRYRGFSKKERQRRIKDSLELVGLAGRMQHLPSQLSGGQQQRVAIARALAGEPRFLLADEPTGNLDANMATSVMQLLQEINKNGTTIIMVTHDNNLAQQVKRKVKILDGRVQNISTEQSAAVLHVTAENY